LVYTARRDVSDSRTGERAAERVRTMPDAEVRERQRAVAALHPRLAYATSFAAGDDAVATALRAVRERVRG